MNTSDTPQNQHRWWALVAMCFALFMVMLDSTVVNVALPAIQRDLNADLTTLEWTVNAYQLAFAVLIVSGGRLGDIFGRRRFFITGVIVFALSSAAIGLTPNATWLIIGRIVQGVGAAFMMPATLSIISNAFPPRERGRAIGIWAGVSAIALAIGPLIGGALTESVGWQSIFLLNLPVAVFALIATGLFVEESRDPNVTRSIDLLGIVTLSIGLGALVLGLVEGNHWGWISFEIIGLFASSLLALVAFVLIERRTREPIIDFTFLKSPSFIGANIVAFGVSFATLATFFFMALYMQNILGYSAFQAGVRFLPTTLALVFMGPIAGRLTDRLGPRTLMFFGVLTVSGSLFWESFITPETTYSFLIGAFLLLGIGMGLVMSPMTTAAMNAVHRTKSGLASGVLSMSRMVGGTFGVAVLGALVSVVGADKLTKLLPNLPPEDRNQIAESLGSGQASQDAVDPAILHASYEAFAAALRDGMRIGAALVLLAAPIAWFLIANRPAQTTAEHRRSNPTTPTNTSERT